MLRRLPYRMQIPLGLALAVMTSALLVSAVAAQISARSARQEIVATLKQAMVLLSAQARPLLVADDTWRTFALLRNTAALLPGVDGMQTRAAILDADGRFFAGSDPSRLATGQQALGQTVNGKPLPRAADIRALTKIEGADDGVSMLDPILSEDGQVLGFVYVDVDGPVFQPDWAAVAKPALIGALLAAIVLVPAGWLVGERMARPVARVADCIARIGRTDATTLKNEIPVEADPELSRINDAVRRLLSEMEVRQAAEQRALSAERLAAVGRITAAVAHEINNPLAGLLTASQTLRLHGGSEVTRLRSIDLIDRGLKQIQTMTAALLPQARVEDRALTPGDLEDVVMLVQPEATRLKVQLTSDLDVTSAFRAPSAVVRQVMLNLLLNAIKAAGSAGSVHMALLGDEHRIQLIARNTGAQLTPAALESRITTEGGSDPDGFGLWICREIAIRFGGGFDLVAASTAATELQFWIPNRETHEQVTAAG
jgi:two-component system, NtrC family, sensor kinase